MIEVPADLKSSNYRLYRDSQDLQLVYVDALQPTAVHEAGAIVWRAQPTSNRAYFVSELQFGATEAGFQSVANLTCDRRTVPVSWEPSPVFAWFRQGDTAQMLARGKTSGFGSHNAVMSGTANAEVMALPIAIAGELSYSGKLAGATVRADGELIALQQVLATVPVGSRAPWAATIADVLIPTLARLVEHDGLTIKAEAVNLPLDGLSELKELVLMEWAHRIVQCAAIESLAFPAAQVKSLTLQEPLDLNINWTKGAIVPVRVVRVLRPEAVVIPIDVDSSVINSVNIVISSNSDWRSFNYVNVFLKSGDSKGQITLTPEEPVQSLQYSGNDFLISAIANAKGYSVDLPVSVEVIENQAVVHLQPLEERAFLVKVDRAMLEQIGEIEVSIKHPALAHMLTPKAEILRLSAKDSDLPTVSAVYRALFWKTNSFEPYEIVTRLSSGILVRWRDSAFNGEVTIDSARLPLLKVLIPSPIKAVEVSQGKDFNSLGVKEQQSDLIAVWSYQPDGGELSIRTQYTLCDRESYWTPWQPIKPNGVVMPPIVAWQNVKFVALSSLKEPLTVEVMAPAIAEDRVLRGVVEVAKPWSLKLPDGGQTLKFQYRVCSTKNADCSVWIDTNRTIVMLDANSVRSQCD